MCVCVSELYKEYRSLKQAKENSSSVAASGHDEQPKSATVSTSHSAVFVTVDAWILQFCRIHCMWMWLPMSPPKFSTICFFPPSPICSPSLSVCRLSIQSDCWGAHLNRSVLPVSSPRLSSQERDSLQASAQYYGLKLKHNLASLSKVRHTLKNKQTPDHTPNG